MLRSVALTACLAALSLKGQTPRQQPAATRPVISANDLRARLSIVADDSMGGRQAGSSGALATQHYIEAELRRLRFVAKGENGGFTQSVPTILRTVGAASLTTTAGRSLALWTDFAPMPWPWANRPIDGATVVYGGALGDSGAIDPRRVEGRFVIMRGPQGRSVFPRVGPGDPLARAAAIAIVWPEGLSGSRVERIRNGLDAGLSVDTTGRRASPLSLVLSLNAAEALLGRSLEGASVGTEGPPVRGSVTLRDSIVQVCCNLIALIPGSDPKLSGQYVALGAHLDHIGTTNQAVDHDSLRAANRARSPVRTSDWVSTSRGKRDSIFNGADDDGSGTVALLEIAETLAAASVKPKRSVLFVWHTAEERGNQGSTWFTDHPTVPLDSIIAQVNVDMVGRGSAADIPNGGSHYLQIIGSRRQSRELGDLIDDVNREASHRFTLDRQFDAPGDRRQLFCRSDHFSYARYGIPIAFITTGEHVDYHQVTDEAQYIDYEHLARVTTFIRDVAVRLGNLEQRLTLDREKPKPNAPCTG